MKATVRVSKCIAHPSLCHAERSWVHPQKQDPLSAPTVLLHVAAVCVPGVLQRIVDVPDRLAEGEPPEVDVQLQFSLQKPGGGGRIHLRYRFKSLLIRFTQSCFLLSITTAELTRLLRKRVVI